MGHTGKDIPKIEVLVRVPWAVDRQLHFMVIACYSLQPHRLASASEKPRRFDEALSLNRIVASRTARSGR